MSLFMPFIKDRLFFCPFKSKHCYKFIVSSLYIL